MDEYISRKDAIKELREVYEHEYPTASGDFDEYASHYVPNVLRNMPAADVQPIKRGNWTNYGFKYVDELKFYYKWAKCSVCGRYSEEIGSYTSYMPNENCSHCGARMEGMQND